MEYYSSGKAIQMKRRKEEKEKEKSEQWKGEREEGGRWEGRKWRRMKRGLYGKNQECEERKTWKT